MEVECELGVRAQSNAGPICVDRAVRNGADPYLMIGWREIGLRADVGQGHAAASRVEQDDTAATFSTQRAQGRHRGRRSVDLRSPYTGRRSRRPQHPDINFPHTAERSAANRGRGRAIRRFRSGLWPGTSGVREGTGEQAGVVGHLPTAAGVYDVAGPIDPREGVADQMGTGVRRDARDGVARNRTGRERLKQGQRTVGGVFRWAEEVTSAWSPSSLRKRRSPSMPATPPPQISAANRPTPRTIPASSYPVIKPDERGTFVLLHKGVPVLLRGVGVARWLW
jgi:hypothetical protein